MSDSFWRSVLCALASIFAVATATAGKMYWIDQTSDEVRRADLDGSGVERIILAEPYEDLITLAVDPAGGKIYLSVWTDELFGGLLQRANLDGSRREKLVGLSALSAPFGLDIDSDAGRIYIGEPSDCDGCGRILRANLDGTNLTSLLLGVHGPSAIAIDPTSARMYWPHTRDDQAIATADLEGNGFEILVRDARPEGLAIDAIARKIYWTDRMDRKILRADLDGSHVEELITEGLEEPWGIAVDPWAGKMYWTDATAGTIRRANLDGSDGELLQAGLPYPSNQRPLDIVLDLSENGPGDERARVSHELLATGRAVTGDHLRDDLHGRFEGRTTGRRLTTGTRCTR